MAPTDAMPASSWSPLSPTPVVTFEDHVEVVPVPHLHFVEGVIHNDLVDEVKGSHQFKALIQRHHRGLAPDIFDAFIGNDANDEVVTVFFGAQQDVQVAHVEDVENARGKPNNLARLSRRILCVERFVAFAVAQSRKDEGRGRIGCHRAQAMPGIWGPW